MAIIIFPTIKEGSGDITFMVRIANTLSDEKKSDEPVIIVSEHKERIQKNYQLRNTIQVLDIEEFQDLIKQNVIVPSLIIEGPTYTLGRSIKAHPTVPILYLREYSSNEELTMTDPATLLSIARNQGLYAINLSSGFREKKNTIRNSETEYGIFVLPELVEIHNNIQTDAQTQKTKLWSMIDPFVIKRLTSEAHPDYTRRHQLYFQYSHYNLSIKKFIEAISTIECTNTKSCDFISVGSDDRTETIKACADHIRKAGFTKIILKTEDGHEAILLDDKENSRTFRVIHLKELKHDDFTKLMAISENIVGATGDQSISEAISLGKIPFYECRQHKEAFYRGMIQLCRNKQWHVLADFLNKSVIYVDEYEDNQNAKNNLINTDTNFSQIFSEFLLFRSLVLQNYDYLELVKTKVNELLASDPHNKSSKILLLQRIDQRIEELTLHELEVLFNIKASLKLGSPISQAVKALGNNFATGIKDTFLNLPFQVPFLSQFFEKKTIKTIPDFVQKYLNQEKEELDTVRINLGSKGVNLLDVYKMKK